MSDIVWQNVIAELAAATLLIGAVDPNAGATADEILALEQIASQVVGAIAAQKGATIDEVVAGLTYEDPAV